MSLGPRREALEAIDRGLDNAEALAVGHGGLQLGIVVDPEHLGAALELEARVAKGMSAFAEAQALWDWHDEVSYQAFGGWRWRW